jgi:hypothetical protein
MPEVQAAGGPLGTQVPEPLHRAGVSTPATQLSHAVELLLKLHAPVLLAQPKPHGSFEFLLHPGTQQTWFTQSAVGHSLLLLQLTPGFEQWPLGAQVYGEMQSLSLEQDPRHAPFEPHLMPSSQGESWVAQTPWLSHACVVARLGSVDVPSMHDGAAPQVVLDPG